MPAQYPSGLDDPMLRQYMMSGPQQNAANFPVSDMGIGIQSNIQRGATGNQWEALRERVMKELAKRGGKKKKDKKDKKTKDSRGQGRGVGASRQSGGGPPVQLPHSAQGLGIA
jgi:hypothetical protein